MLVVIGFFLLVGLGNAFGESFGFGVFFILIGIGLFFARHFLSYKPKHKQAMDALARSNNLEKKVAELFK